MKKGMLLLLLSLIFITVFCSSVTAFATTIDKSEKLVKQGPGYKVYSSDIPDEQKTIKEGIGVSANSYNYDTLSYNTSEWFCSLDNPYWNDGYFILENNTYLSNSHSLTSYDYLTTDGDMYAYWSGYVPSGHADTLMLQPVQTITASQEVLSFSVPWSVTTSGSGTQKTFSYPQVNLLDRYNGTYDWASYKVRTLGHFSGAVSTAYATWVFGGYAYGQQSTLDIDITEW